MFLEYENGENSIQYSYHTINTPQTSSLPFAVSVIGDFNCDTNFYTRRHGREDCLLLYTVEGEGLIGYEDKTLILPPNQLILIDCRKHHYYAAKGENWHFLWVHFSGKSAFEYVELLNATEASPISFDFSKYFKQLLLYVTSFDLHNELEISLTMHTMLTKLISAKRTTESGSKYHKFNDELENNILFLKQHFSEDLSISECAKHMNLSKYYYIKVFKAYTGQTPYDYLLGIRLQAAQKMLLETDLAVSTIAEQCGFANSKNFIPHFKQKAGMTPYRFRKTYSILSPAKNNI